jgi:Domain of unknown function (DUF397)
MGDKTMNEQWRKSSRSNNGTCVELARLSDGSIGVRNSNNPQAGMVRFTPAEVDAFLQGAKAGEFDDLAA